VTRLLLEQQIAQPSIFPAVASRTLTTIEESEDLKATPPLMLILRVSPNCRNRRLTMAESAKTGHVAQQRAFVFKMIRSM